MDSPPTTPTLTDPKVQVEVADRAFTLVRWFDAPRERVWRAWTDPAELAQWWGPHGYTNPVTETDVRPGGSLRIVMRSPEGTEFPVTGQYLEVDPPSRIVFTDVLSDEMPAEWRARIDRYRPSSAPGTPLRITTTVTFEERDGRTLLTIRNVFLSDEDRDAVMRDGAAAGWAESLERLDTLVTAA
jgi:uncharacterized protein YndB with AHSA1/START domain